MPELHQSALMMSQPPTLAISATNGNPDDKNHISQSHLQNSTSNIPIYPFNLYKTTNPSTKMAPRSDSIYRSADNLARTLGLSDETQEQEQQEHKKPDHSRVTSRGAPARHSRRERSEYRSWDRASDRRNVGETGSKARSTSRH